MARILLVENDSAASAIMHRALTGAGHDVTVAQDGRDGRAALAEGPPFDLVLAEMALPGLDGVDLAAEVSREFPDTRVLLIATHAGLVNGDRPR
jgi:CheY-like chemotaxis protein